MKGFIIYFSKDFNSFYSKNLSIFINIYFNNENINDKINEFKIDFYNESKDYFKNFKDSSLRVYYLKDNIIRFIIDFIITFINV